ncbi:MAG: hypothetical protein VKJ46_09205, partial [Leptolyngbyaceae bacterium]|nr:hypothetical protein [Leptolyngbyaceae bacterium]
LCALPIYQGLQQVTGLNQLPTQMIDKLVAETTQAAYQGLTAALEDPIGAQLMGRLMQHLAIAIEAQIRDPQNIQRVQYLLSEQLEELKISYVRRSGQENLEDVLELTRRTKAAEAFSKSAIQK